MRRTPSVLLLASVGVVGLFLPRGAAELLGQVEVEVAAPGETPPGKDGVNGVYVRDSALALEKLALADRMERSREWAKSADVLQEILEKYPDRVVAIPKSDSRAGERYTSVGSAVAERLSRWPVEGLNAYRTRYEASAAALIDPNKPDDLAALHKVASLYFATDTAKAALVRLSDIYREDGQFPASVWAAERLLTLHPNLGSDRPMILYRAALALHLSGDDTGAKRWAEELQQKYADTIGTVAGKDVKLVDALARDLAVPAPVAQALTGDSWPMFGGSAARDRVSSAAGRPGAKLYGIALQPPNWKSVNPPDQRETMRGRDQSDRASGDLLGVIPSVDGGELFFQDGARVYAVSLESGTPLPGWTTTYPTRAGQYALANAWPLPRGTQLTTTVTDTDVLAVMGQTDRLFIQFGMNQAFNLQGGAPVTGVPTGGARLVCLDRTTGAEKWVFSPRSAPQEQAHLRTLELAGTPLADGDHVYIGARGGKGAQFEDCYVICLDRATGKVTWSCYVASAASGANPWDGTTNTSDTTPLLSAAGGRIYALSNLGAVASIDAYTGSIVWLGLYPRDASVDPNSGNFAMRARFGRMGNGGIDSASPKPWIHNPPILHEGKLFVLPTDGKFLTVYDAATGAEVKRVDPAHFDGADELLGVVGDAMVLASAKQVWCVRWPAYDVTNFKGLDDDSIQWMNTPGDRRGRGFVTRDAVVVATDKRMARIDLKLGRVTQNYPTAERSPQEWSEDEGAGNVLVTADHVIVAGDARVDVYTDLDMAGQKLDREIAAAPNDPAPRLRFAEVMFVAGKTDLSIEKLDEAIELLGGLKSMRAGEARERVFNNALTFAQKLTTSKETSEANVTLAGKLFERAALAADGAQQQVAWRAASAKVSAAHGRSAQAVALWQDILSDGPMRDVPLGDDEVGNGNAEKASAVAERAIDRIVRATPDAYKPFEEQAKAAYDSAKASDDPVALLAVARTFPNSRVSSDAMLTAAAKYERDGDAKTATSVLRVLYLRAPRGPATVQVLEALARNYLTMPDRLDSAVARLTRAAQLDPNRRLDKPLRLPDGSTLRDITYGSAVVELKKARGTVIAAELPDFHIPTASQFRSGKKTAFTPPVAEASAKNVGMIVPTTRGRTRYDRVVTWTVGVGVRLFGVGDSTPAWTCAGVVDTPLGCAWVGDDLLVWSAKQVALVRPKDAKPQAGGPVAPIVWKMNVGALPLIDVSPLASDASGASDVEAQPQVLLAPQQQALLRRNQMLRLGMRRGFPVNNAPAPAALDEALDASNNTTGEAVVHVRVAGDRVIVGTSMGRVTGLDLTDGSVAWQSRISDRGIERMIGGDDFTVVRVLEDGAMQVAVFDTLDGSVVFRRSYSMEGAGFPVNLALSSDGALVLMMPDRLLIRDLYQQTGSSSADGPGVVATTPSPDGNPIFATSALPDQLLVSEGRVLAVSDNGQFVRAYSLERGNELMKPLSTGAPGGAAMLKLRLVGSQLYVTGPRTITAYNLDKIEQSWTGGQISPNQVNLRDVMVGRDYVLLVDQPAERLAVSNRALPGVTLHAFNREQGDNGEAGVQLFSHKVASPTGATSWQEVDGGFYYVGADKVLNFIRGAGQ